ncbi:hypothetical protein IKD57_01010 [Candidatus Saccharibacteria bacterium]|nr:hypothetical protein [Candidatus Saccharibacteria bacterium]
MKNSLKKRGQKLAKKFSRVSERARIEGKEHIKENLIARISHIENIKLLIFEWCLLTVALIMLATAQAFWFGDSYAQTAFVDGGTYTEATIGQVDSMNPLFATTDSEKVLSKLMFATLIADDYSGHPGMGLAKSLTPSEDGKVWTLKLKDNLKWSDGEALTNEDVMFTLDLIQNPVVSTVYSANLSGVKINENESGEIVFTLPSAYADFIAMLDIPIVPKHELEDSSPKTLIEDDFSVSPVASGPFILNATQTNSEEESVIYLSPNPNYYQEKPMLSGFAIHTYEDKEAVEKALKTSAVTATAELNNKDVEDLNLSNFITKEAGINWGVFAFFNTSNQKLKNKELRQAIRQGINTSAVRDAAKSTMALNYPIMESQIALSKYPALPEFNHDAAVAKIAEITGGETLQINVTTVDSGYLPEAAEVIAEELRGLGIASQVIVYSENQDFITNVLSPRHYDILVYEIELDVDPDPLPYYHSSQASASGLNLSNYRNALVDDLLVGARETLDTDLRSRKYETFLEHWAEDVPAIGLFQANLVYLYNKNVRTFGESVKLAAPLDRFSDITNWAVARGTKNKTP